MSVLSQLFHEGGVAMWPTLLLGSLALALAVHQAVQPRAGLTPLIVGLGTATLLSGALGVTSGVIATLKHVQQMPHEQQAAVVRLGVAESLSNAALALGLAVLVALAAGIGAFRAPRAAAAG